MVSITRQLLYLILKIRCGQHLILKSLFLFLNEGIKEFNIVVNFQFIVGLVNIAVCNNTGRF